ncbi:MAG: hypothetical protein WCE21_05870 [Candidatus Babeliales bacterium]
MNKRSLIMMIVAICGMNGTSKALNFNIYEAVAVPVVGLCTAYAIHDANEFIGSTARAKAKNPDMRPRALEAIQDLENRKTRDVVVAVVVALGTVAALAFGPK